MGIKRLITRMIFKDTRGMNPNSLANLKQGRDPSPSPAPPLPPAPDPSPSRAPPSFQQAQSFFEQMQQYEAWKMQVYQAEEARRRSIYQEAFEAAREEIGEDDGSDSMEETLIKSIAPILINKFAAAQGGGSAPMAIDAPNTPPPATDQSPPVMSRDDARRLIDSFAKQKPKLLKDVRSGKYSKEEVLSFLSLQGIPRENAEILYAEATSSQDGS